MMIIKEQETIDLKRMGNERGPREERREMQFYSK